MRKYILLTAIFILAITIGIYFNKRSSPKALPSPARKGQTLNQIVNTDQPFSYNILVSNLKSLQEAYPEQIKTSIIGHSILGRDLYLIRLGTGGPKLLITGIFHGREWLTGMLALKMAEEYAKATKHGQPIGPYQPEKLFKKGSILFVPMVNPDGVEIVLRGTKGVPNPGLLRKANEGSNNFTRWKTNARGVNLNIQFQAAWDRAISLSQPHYEKYKGPRPESEPESHALAELVRKEKPAAMISYHSSGEVVYWQYGQTGKTLKQDLELAKGLSRLTGYRLSKEPRSESYGGFKDWFIKEYRRPGFTIEIGEPVDDRSLPLSWFSKIWRENRQVPLFVLNKLPKYSM